MSNFSFCLPEKGDARSLQWEESFPDKSAVWGEFMFIMWIEDL